MSRRTVSARSRRHTRASRNLPHEIVIIANWADRKVVGVYRTKKSIQALLATKEVKPDVVFVENRAELEERLLRNLVAREARRTRG